MSTLDGGLLYRTPTGLHRCPLPECDGGAEHFALSEYLGVGTGTIDVMAIPVRLPFPMIGPIHVLFWRPMRPRRSA